jgi:hypothetical protein
MACDQRDTPECQRARGTMGNLPPAHRPTKPTENEGIRRYLDGGIRAPSDRHQASARNARSTDQGWDSAPPRELDGAVCDPRERRSGTG